MDLCFATKKLERQLGDATAMQRAFGDLARRLQMRLDLLRAAPCLADVPSVPPPRRHKLSGDWRGHYALDIAGNWRLIFKPVSSLAASGFDYDNDLRGVTVIEIVEIIDYHGN